MKPRLPDAGAHALPAARRRLAAALLALLTGCAAPPPAPLALDPVPASFKEGFDAVAAAPALDAHWWSVYADARLDALEAQALAHQPTVEAARAAHAQASAALAQARAALWPTLGVDASTGRQRDIIHSGRARRFTEDTWNRSERGLEARWAPDLWGAAAADIDAQRALLGATEAAEGGARLGTTALVAQAWFDLCQADSDIAQRMRVRALLEQSAAIDAAQLARGRLSHDDLLRAQQALDAEDARLAMMRRARAVGEHALAEAVGQAPASFVLPTPVECTSRNAGIPPTLPSELLQRRPDIAQALHRVEATQAGIEAANTHWFPQLTLGAAVRGESDRLFDWLQMPAHLWAVGPTIAATLFDGGARAAQLDAATARRDEAVAAYRQAVLSAFREVEDLLASRRELAQRDDAAHAAAVKAEALVQSVQRQRARGLASPRDELEVRRQALEADLAWRDDVHESRRIELLLVQAIGGGWTAQASDEARDAAGGEALAR